MILRSATRIVQVLCSMAALSMLAQAGCPVYVVVVKGRAELAPRGAKVRVQLVYAKGRPGESGETTVENGAFSIPIEFLTESRRPKLIGELGQKCARRPTSVSIALVKDEEEYDRITLDFTCACFSGIPCM